VCECVSVRGWVWGVHVCTVVLVWWLLSKRLLQVKGLGPTGGLSMGGGEIGRRSQPTAISGEKPKM